MGRVLEHVVVSILSVLEFDHEGIFEAILDTRQIRLATGLETDAHTLTREVDNRDVGRLTLAPSGELSLPPEKDLM